MANVLLACELGSGRAHLRRLLALAGALRARGHDVCCVVNDLAKAEVVLGDQGFTVLPCPTWRSPVAGLPPLRTYTDILLRQGFVDAMGLRGLARAWRHLVALLQPDLMLFDHAPVALFATRGLGLARLRFGDGFGCPPLQTPMLPCAWWVPGSDPFDAIGERNVLHVANQVAADLGLPVAASVADFLRADADLLCTLPELDHYGQRGDADCVGPLLPSNGGAGPATPWPSGDAPLAYVYLRPDCAQLEAVVQALREQAWQAVLHVPGLASARAKTLLHDRLHLSPEPVPLADAARRCTVAISHGGYAITHAMALAGKPQLLLTVRLEQLMVSHRLQAAGVALVAERKAAAPELAAQLQQLLSPAVQEAATDLAQRHAGHATAATLQTLVQRCEALLAPAP